MPILPALNIILSMCFIYIIFCVMVSAIRESIESWYKSRALHLARGINLLVGSSNAAAFYRSPLVNALYPDGAEPGIQRLMDLAIAGAESYRGLSLQQIVGEIAKKPVELPSYIPARVFAQTILQDLRTAAAAPQGSGYTLAQVGNWIAGMNLSDRRWAAVHAALLTADSMEDVLQSLEHWYDSTMERVAGWYKRESQCIMFVIGLTVAAFANVDSISIVRFFIANPDVAAKVVNEAEKNSSTQQSSPPLPPQAGPGEDKCEAGQDKTKCKPTGVVSASDSAKSPSATAVEEMMAVQINGLRSLNVPLGWSKRQWRDLSLCKGSSWLMFLGWLLTAFALSFGAPFWFDLLNKVMFFRSSLKPDEDDDGKKRSKAA